MKYNAIRFLLLCCCWLGLQVGHAQQGSFSATISSAENHFKPIKIEFTKPAFKFNDTHGYWYINTHNSSRHFTLEPPPGYGNADVAMIDMHERLNDIDLYESGNDSDQVSLKNANYVILAPKWDVKLKDKIQPALHFHFTTFTATEIAFTLTGTVSVNAQKDNGYYLGAGTINATGHFYREAPYAKSDILPGCNCDPVIYAGTYDQENNIRTASGCEEAFKNKLFDAVQQSVIPLYNNLAFKGRGKMAAGEIQINKMPGHVELNIPVKDRPFCSVDYDHIHTVPLDAETRLYSDGDSYGLRFIRMPSDAVMGTPNAQGQKQQAMLVDSLMKLVVAKKMTVEQYSKAVQDSYNKSNGLSSTPDLKEQEMENNLYLQIIINPSGREGGLLKMNDKNKTLIQHAVTGSAFEIFTPQTKDNDGSWNSNKEYIYLGQFSKPVAGKSMSGFDAQLSAGIYPPNGNKLTVYAILIKMEGGKDLIDKAIAQMNFAALKNLLTTNQ